MSPSVVCYAEPNKQKSKRVLEAFAVGCGGRMAKTTAEKLEPGDCAFYGVRTGWAHLWAQCKAEGRTYYYADNSYFDCARESQFRFTRNAIQHKGSGQTDGTRFKRLGMQVRPLRSDGDYVLVCEQSEEFMRVVANDPDYFKRVTKTIASWGLRVLVRKKNEPRRLLDDLARAKLLVTWSSAAAVGAILEGVRVSCGPFCCAMHVGSDRTRWAGVLADNQWTLDELASGVAWQTLGTAG